MHCAIIDITHYQYYVWCNSLVDNVVFKLFSVRCTTLVVMMNSRKYSVDIFFVFFFFANFLLHVRTERFCAEFKVVKFNIGKNNISLSDERYDELILKVLAVIGSKKKRQKTRFHFVWKKNE